VVTSTSGRVSIRDAQPQETGGYSARKGFAYQDHVAAELCLHMVTDEALLEVWCEAQDDITLIWNEDNGQGETVEYVQVKDNEFDQLWTIAKLCEKESSTKATNDKSNGAHENGIVSESKRSILQKSLDYDYVTETCVFRVVTSRDIKKELAILQTLRNCPERDLSNSDFKKLHDTVGKTHAGYHSKNGNDYSYWLQQAIWDVKGPAGDLEMRNRHRLELLIQDMGFFLAPNQRHEVYRKILHLVKDAAEAHPIDAPEDKRLKRATFMATLQQIVHESRYPGSSASTTALEDKMARANLSGEEISAAISLRLKYSVALRRSEYLALADADNVTGAVEAELLSLLVDLDNGDYDPNGPQFHRACVKQIERMPTPPTVKSLPAKDFLFGCMYDITNRCSHRFSRVNS